MWTKEYCSRFLNAQKDTIYRFLNHCRFNWRRFITILINRVLAITDSSPFNDRVLIVDDSVLPKTGKEMELVSYHFDHKTNRSQLGYQMLQLGYHNKAHFFPVDAAFHTSKNRTNDTLRSLDKRCSGWKRRAETFRKKTEVLIEMLQRSYNNGIDARFVLFDSWFANDGLQIGEETSSVKVVRRRKGNSLFLNPTYFSVKTKRGLDVDRCRISVEI